jgi:hypothetical protein
LETFSSHRSVHLHINTHGSKSPCWRRLFLKLCFCGSIIKKLDWRHPNSIFQER